MPKWRQNWRGESWCGAEMHTVNVTRDSAGWWASTPDCRIGPFETDSAAKSAVIRLYRRTLRRALAALK